VILLGAVVARAVKAVALVKLGYRTIGRGFKSLRAHQRQRPRQLWRGLCRWCTRWAYVSALGGWAHAPQSVAVRSNVAAAGWGQIPPGAPIENGVTFWWRHSRFLGSGGTLNHWGPRRAGSDGSRRLLACSGAVPRDLAAVPVGRQIPPGVPVFSGPDLLFFGLPVGPLVSRFESCHIAHTHGAHSISLQRRDFAARSASRYQCD
jgi:hypothetical protein